MKQSKIPAISTYHRCLKNIISFGYIPAGINRFIYYGQRIAPGSCQAHIQSVKNKVCKVICSRVISPRLPVLTFCYIAG